MRTDIFKAAQMEREMVDAPAEGIVLTDDNAMTKEEIKEALPAQLRARVSDSLVEKINGISMDPLIADEIRNNFIGFNSVMKEGKFKIEDYLNACAYVTYKMMGYSNSAAYKMTFPDRAAKFVAEGRDEKYISSFSSVFHKSKLVTILMDQALIPAYLLNQDLFQKALNHCASLMTTAKSEKVQVDAAKAVMEALRQPEKTKVELDVAIKDHSGIGELKKAMGDLAAHQVKLLEAGATTKEIAHQEIFDKDGAPVE